MATVTPFLWFDGTAGEAMDLYLSVFKDSKEVMVHRMGDQVIMAIFTINGQEVMALNGGPEYKPTEAFSFYVSCADQAEVDYYWDALTADGGEAGRCGWLKDRFGVSWQIIPKRLGELMSDPDQERAGRVTQAMLGMGKIDVAALEAA